MMEVVCLVFKTSSFLLRYAPLHLATSTLFFHTEWEFLFFLFTSCENLSGCVHQEKGVGQWEAAHSSASHLLWSPNVINSHLSPKVLRCVTAIAFLLFDQCCNIFVSLLFLSYRRPVVSIVIGTYLRSTVKHFVRLWKSIPSRLSFVFCFFKTPKWN